MKSRSLAKAAGLTALLTVAFGGCGGGHGHRHEGKGGSTPPPPPPNPACVGEGPCATGCDLCSYACVDLTADPSNCGACATVCNPGLSCVSGHCKLVCSGTQTRCGDACTDFASDGGNCGACGHACSAAAACVSGRCVTPTTLVTGLADPGGIAVDSADVYFYARGDDYLTHVESVPVGGGAVHTLGGSVSGPTQLAADAHGVYWGDASGFYRVPLGGGATTHISTAGSGMFAMDATHFYWPGADSYIDKAAIDGSGGVEQLAPYYSDGGIALAVDGAYVYWVIWGSLNRTPLSGGSATTVASYTLTGDANVSPLVLGGSSLYWVLNGDGALLASASPVVGTSVTMSDLGLGSCGGACVPDIKADADFLYFLDAGNADIGSGSVGRVSIATGAITTLAIGQTRPQNLAVDDTGIYWLDLGSPDGNYGTIRMLPK